MDFLKLTTAFTTLGLLKITNSFLALAFLPEIDFMGLDAFCITLEMRLFELRRGYTVESGKTDCDLHFVFFDVD